MNVFIPTNPNLLLALSAKRFTLSNEKLLQKEIVACVKCGCVKQMIGNTATYFINDTSYDKAPKCVMKEKMKND